MNTDQPLVAAVVPVFNRMETTRRFVEAFRSLGYARKILVICDDGSTDGTFEFLTAQPDVITVRGDGSLWWSGGTNTAIREALRLKADYVLTINDDAIFEPDYLDRLVETALNHPGCIVASQIVQDDAQDRCWSLGASYINCSFQLYALDGFGARVSHLRTLLASAILVDTAPGNGVLYPADVFAQVGCFDEVWTPQYHGDSLLVQRARSKGVRAWCSLQASLRNDVSHHRNANAVDLLLSIKSDFYAPSIYKTIEEREGPDVALDSLGDLVAAVQSDFCPEMKTILKSQPPQPIKWGFADDNDFVQTFSGGAFTKLGYCASDGLSVRFEKTGMNREYQVRGAGVLSLGFKIHSATVVYVFVVSEDPLKHVDVVMECLSRGESRINNDWVAWFVVPLAKADFSQIPLSIINHGQRWHGVYVVSEENVASKFRPQS